MQVKEFEAYTLKECLQQVRDSLGADAVILETRKFRKGGLLGWGAKDAVRIVAATGITVQEDFVSGRNGQTRPTETPPDAEHASRKAKQPEPTKPASTSKRGLPKEAVVSARNTQTPNSQANGANLRHLYAKSSAAQSSRETVGVAAAISPAAPYAPANDFLDEETVPAILRPSARLIQEAEKPAPTQNTRLDAERLASLERTMREIRDTLSNLQAQHLESEDRTVSALVSAVAPALASVVSATQSQPVETSCPELYQKLLLSGVGQPLAEELVEALPDLSAWSEEARLPLAESALSELLASRLPVGGPIRPLRGKLKAVALIGPTGVGKTTTIAKLAAHFALVENKRVALLTVDTYRIAAVEQLKVYSQIIDIPIGIAYSEADVLAAVKQFSDYDILLIDTAGRSPSNIMQIRELKTLLESVHCENHLVLSAPTKESDMIEAAERFAAAQIDRIIFTKLDETRTYGTLLNVSNRTGIPLSYLTNGQKVPEDLLPADFHHLTELILGGAPAHAAC